VGVLVEVRVAVGCSVHPFQQVPLAERGLFGRDILEEQLLEMVLPALRA
jgi:hypothetical protein